MRTASTHLTQMSMHKPWGHSDCPLPSSLTPHIRRSPKHNRQIKLFLPGTLSPRQSVLLQRLHSSSPPWQSFLAQPFFLILFIHTANFLHRDLLKGTLAAIADRSLVRGGSTVNKVRETEWNSRGWAICN